MARPGPHPDHLTPVRHSIPAPSDRTPEQAAFVAAVSRYSEVCFEADQIELPKGLDTIGAAVEEFVKGLVLDAADDIYTAALALTRAGTTLVIDNPIRGEVAGQIRDALRFPPPRETRE